MVNNIIVSFQPLIKTTTTNTISQQILLSNTITTTSPPAKTTVFQVYNCFNIDDTIPPSMVQMWCGDRKNKMLSNGMFSQIVTFVLTTQTITVVRDNLNTLALQNFTSLSRSYALPRTGEENTARVLVVTFLNTSSISQFRSFQLMSTNTGFRPA